MEAASSSETSASNYQSIRRLIPEDTKSSTTLWKPDYMIKKFSANTDSNSLKVD
jgi:hypothetical protein